MRSLVARSLLLGACAASAACALRSLGGAPYQCAPTVMAPTGRTARIPDAPPPPAAFGTIVGIVVDSTSRVPMHGANVRVFIDPLRSVPTDSLGGYVVDSLPPGRARVGARWFGAVPKVLSVSVRAGRVDTVVFALQSERC